MFFSDTFFGPRYFQSDFFGGIGFPTPNALIFYVYPPSGTTNVAIATPVYGIFTGPVSPTGNITLTLSDNHGSGVPGTVGYDPSSFRTDFVTTWPLNLSTQYTATLSFPGIPGVTWPFTTSASAGGGGGLSRKIGILISNVNVAGLREIDIRIQ